MRTAKSFHKIFFLLLAILSGIAQAEANSRFTVKNDGSTKALVNIFNGDDSICSAEAKHHTVGEGSEQGMGCVGGGKNRCKARISVRVDDKWSQTCLQENDGCGDTVVILKNHATLYLTDNGSGGTNCKIVESD